MVGEDRVMMSVKELRRVQVIRQAMEKTLTQRQAGALVGVTARHVRRLIERVQQEGAGGLAHRGRGQPSNRKIPEQVNTTVLTLDAQRDGGFGPTVAAEPLAERQGMLRSDETLRRWLTTRGIAQFTRCKRPHRAWRERKPHVGELLQLDGSHHDWFEGRGPRCAVMASIDDASSRVFARFYESEGTIPALDRFPRYVPRDGIPLAVYADKPPTYQSPAQPTVEEQLAGAKPTSQFGRALGVALIPAHSPQATGRIERLFHTFQDRVIKEMRLAGMATIAAAKRFLETSLPIYNRRGTVEPAQAADLPRPRPAARALDHILCLQTTRVVRRDWTVAHHGQLYQIDQLVRTTQVLVEDWLNGTRRITSQGRPLRSHAIPERPMKTPEGPLVQVPPRPVKPAPTHPWQQRRLPERRTTTATPRL